MNNKIVFFLLLLSSHLSLASGAAKNLGLAGVRALTPEQVLNNKVRGGFKTIIEKGLRSSCSRTRQVFKSVLCDEGYPVGNIVREHFYMRAVLRSLSGVNAEGVLITHCYPRASADRANILHEVAKFGLKDLLKIAAQDFKGFAGNVKSLNLEDQYGNSAVDYALLKGHLLCVKILAEEGALLGESHYAAALAMGYEDIAQYIREQLDQQ